jgi:hypothetical protein
MNPFIIQVSQFRAECAFKRRSLDNLIEMYGGKPLDHPEPTPTPTPTPVPQPSPIIIDEFTISVPGAYQIVKKGSGTVPTPVPT